LAAHPRLRKYVLDANALIGFFEDQPGIAKKVQDVFEQALHNDAPVFNVSRDLGRSFLC
jgi:hypothetical protein